MQTKNMLRKVSRERQRKLFSFVIVNNSVEAGFVSILYVLEVI